MAVIIAVDPHKANHGALAIGGSAAVVRQRCEPGLPRWTSWWWGPTCSGRRCLTDGGECSRVRGPIREAV